uniref:BPTI/Kunitz inhibitor domain-containing protein n=1 Tax=Globodera rostochiensis TaxID=31243 RepID=A0A914HL92_GLORO
MPQIRRSSKMVEAVLLLSFTSITLLFQTVQPSTPGGPNSEHGVQCNAPWRPNLIGTLEKCSTEKKDCQEGYQCIDVGFCCPDKETVCRMDTDSGHESAAEVYKHFRRYAYNTGLGSCTIFSYFGAGGNFNNFRKFSECKKFCQ